ncbi:MAG: hypothetical protein M0R46_01275 [Candidatus Muirbacterium halophilum]|nr:hypothetical protein [Candidatus Muirbacterium halophilum]MCK9474525.1 hypothetical protein [Candidatus Muirbacterium halophilum]
MIINDIDTTLKIHDNFNLEQKTSFLFQHGKPCTNYIVENYFFVPKNLGFNQEAIKRDTFYKRVQNYVRFKSPICTLKQIAYDSRQNPFLKLDAVIEKVTSSDDLASLTEYEIELKRTGSAIKAALRDYVMFLRDSKTEDDLYVKFINNYCEYSDEIIKKLHKIWEKLHSPGVDSEMLKKFLWMEEACLVFINEFSDNLIFLTRKKLDRKSEVFLNCELSLLKLIEKNNKTKEKKHKQKTPSCKKDLEEFLFRKGVLKKYISSVLFLNINHQKEPRRAEHVLYAIAAGIAMIVSILGAIYFQQRYDTFSFPVITALIISYMFKDRIKAIFQNIFSSLLSKYYYDYKIKITDKFHGTFVGTCWQRFRFLNLKEVPKEITFFRLKNPLEALQRDITGENIFVYKKKIELFPRNIHAISQDINGVNDIMRLNVKDFLDNMDNPKSTVFVMKQAGYEWEDASKFYYINLCTYMKSQNVDKRIYYRIKLNRNGIKSIKTLQ